MKKIVAANKYTVIAAAILGAVGILVGTISDNGAPCKEVAESFLKLSPEVKSRVGKIRSMTLRRRVSVEASTNEAAHVSYTFMVRGEVEKAMIILKADSKSFSFVVESIDTSS